MSIDCFVDVFLLSKKKCSHPIQGSIVYGTSENFLGRIVKGYDPEAIDVCLMTRLAAEKICLVQNELNQKNLGLYIFDAYRPLRAVKDFGVWMRAPVSSEQELSRKHIHYPKLQKIQLSELSYVMDTVSKHCYGSTVDLVLVDLQTNQLLDMGAPFDYFDQLSHIDAPAELIGSESFQNRKILTETMQGQGFAPYSKEYWHFDGTPEITAPADFEITSKLRGLGVL